MRFLDPIVILAQIRGPLIPFPVFNQPEMTQETGNGQIFNFAYQVPSIEMQHISVAGSPYDLEQKFLKDHKKGAICHVFPVFMEPEVGKETGNGRKPTQLNKSRP